MQLKLACADFTFPILPHEQVLALISMLGLKGVDIGLFEDRSHLQPSTEFENVQRSGRALGQQLADNGLVAADLFLQLALDYESHAVNHPQPEIRRHARDAFLKVLDYAAECDGKHVTGLPGAFFDHEPKPDSMARAAEELAWRVEQAQAHDVVFAIEPHIGSLANTPERAAVLVQAVPGLTLTLDYGHFVPRGFAADEVDPPAPARHSLPRARRQQPERRDFLGRRRARLAAHSQHHGSNGVQRLARIGVRGQQPHRHRRIPRLLALAIQIVGAIRHLALGGQGAQPR